MNESDQISHFGDDLDRLVDRYRDEYDLTIASVVGALFAKATLLVLEAKDRSDEL